MEALIATAPLVFLVLAMGFPRGLSGHLALPLAAALAFVLYHFQFDLPLDLLSASAITGALSALTPLSIIFGAMLLFRILKVTGQLAVIGEWIRSVSPHPVAQLMLIGWAFPFLIEGISGFGTPAALAAPLLVGLGFSPLKACFMTLLSNSVPVAFGAIGTPIWFGLGETSLSTEDMQAVTQLVGATQFLVAFLVPVIGLAQIVPFAVIKASWRFIVLSTLSCTLPFFLVSLVSNEFPSIIGGLTGFLITLGLAKGRVGLGPLPQSNRTEASPLSSPSPMAVLLATFPIWASVLLLLATRLPSLGLKSLLTSSAPWIAVTWDRLGSLTVSPSFNLSLELSLGGEQSLAKWTHATLYVPSLIPFVVVAAASMFLQRTAKIQDFWSSCVQTGAHLGKPFLALFGALVLVKLMIAGDASHLSAAATMGEGIGRVFGSSWPWFALSLGALGSFFSGSATVSNLTFGPLQQTLGMGLGELILVIALQAVGAALGNMVCLHNIIAVTAILGLHGAESVILRRNAILLVLLGSLATAMSIAVSKTFTLP